MKYYLVKIPEKYGDNFIVFEDEIDALEYFRCEVISSTSISNSTLSKYQKIIDIILSDNLYNLYKIENIVEIPITIQAVDFVEKSVKDDD